MWQEGVNTTVSREILCLCLLQPKHVHLLFIQQEPKGERHTALVCDKPMF